MADELNICMSINSRANRDAMRALLDALDAAEDRDALAAFEKEFSLRSESDVRREPDTCPMGNSSLNSPEASASGLFPSASAGHSEGGCPPGPPPPSADVPVEEWPTSVDEIPSEPAPSPAAVGAAAGADAAEPSYALSSGGDSAEGSAPHLSGAAEAATGGIPVTNTDPVTPVAEVGKAPAGFPAPAGAPDWDELVAQVVIDGREPAHVAYWGSVDVGDLRRHIKRVRDAKRRGGKLTGRLAPKEKRPELVDEPVSGVDQAQPPTADEPPSYDHIANLCGMVEKGLGTVADIARKHDADPRTIKARLESRAKDREAAAAKVALWTPERDLMLAEAILAGSGGFDRAAAELGLPRDKVVERWNELLPAKGYRQQAELMARLRGKFGALT
jgi:hypothetical protein